MEESRNPYLPARRREGFRVKKSRLLARPKREGLSLPQCSGIVKRKSLQDSLRASPSFTRLSMKSVQESPLVKSSGKQCVRTPKSAKHTKDLIGNYGDKLAGHSTYLHKFAASDFSLWLVTARPQFIADARITMQFSESLADKENKLAQCHSVFLRGFEQLVQEVSVELPDKASVLSELLAFYQEVLALQQGFFHSLQPRLSAAALASVDKQRQLLEQLQALTAAPVLSPELSCL